MHKKETNGNYIFFDVKNIQNDWDKKRGKHITVSLLNLFDIKPITNFLSSLQNMLADADRPDKVQEPDGILR